ncbi:MAG: uvrD2, partial [Acidimicrobiales bacterium]|nr:uvrD2 [Acidimicrobiales bacterium]
APAASRRAEPVEPRFKKGAKGAKGARGAAPVDGIEVREGMVVKVLGGYEGAVEEADGRSVRVRLPTGGTLTVKFGERVEHDGRSAPLAPPTELWGAAAQAEAALRAWRTERSKADGMPAYIVSTDASLRSIALARPTDAAGLLACDGIGPTKLERYGDDILAALDQVTA